MIHTTLSHCCGTGNGKYPSPLSYNIFRMTWLLTPPHHLEDADHCANRTFLHESVVRSNREYGVVSLVPLLIALQAVRIVTSKDIVVCRLLGRLLMWNFRWLPPQIALYLGFPLSTWTEDLVSGENRLYLNFNTEVIGVVKGDWAKFYSVTLSFYSKFAASPLRIYSNRKNIKVFHGCIARNGALLRLHTYLHK